MTPPAPAGMTHQGRPVPYIAAWSQEKTPLPRVLAVPGGMTLAGCVDDSAGVSWRPWSSRPGVGEPRPGEVHGPRQRYAMRHLLCRVCARPVVRDRHGWPWLLEDHRGGQGRPEREVTTHPPVCPDCRPVAAEYTHLRAGAVAVRVGRVLTDGVHGTLYGPAGGQTVAPRRETTVFRGDTRLRWVLGSRTAATLLDVTVVAVLHARHRTPDRAPVVRR
ncbi:hypothetical protein [Streptomyces sp. NRRL S-31]|uniref:hypothetical protein n=1 Tax=Streptomyces sp. NRRL S-31 TaxID=1463898 RepID=UPI00069A865D|nr:hypothetical protein [Streptomyces sp. NRRL S-31]